MWTYKHIADKLWCCKQNEVSRRREYEMQKMKKDFELINIQHESSEANLRKRHQDSINELTEQIDHLNKLKAK